jgi:hypothetical protein
MRNASSRAIKGLWRWRIVVATAGFDCQLVAALTTTKAPDRGREANLRDNNPDGGHMRSRRIQADFGEEKYPIGRFILERARMLDMSRGDLVHRLGYRDTDTGHAALLTGLVAPQMANHLADAIEVDNVLAASVIGATIRQKRDATPARPHPRYHRHLVHRSY